MNELQRVFDYGGLVECCCLLSLAIDFAHNGDREMSEGCMKAAQQCAIRLGDNDHVFNNLYGAVRTDLAWLERFDRHEFSLQSLFKEKLDGLLPGSKLINGPSNSQNRPDAWVELEGEKIPVEVKKDAFDAKAVKQLLRYMKAFGCQHGIACAPSLSAPLPSNIRFIQLRKEGR